MTLPVSIRVNLKAPFPALVTGADLIEVTKANGVWTIGSNFSGLAHISAGFIPANTIFPVQDVPSGEYYYATLTDFLDAALATPVRIITGTGAVTALITDGDILINKTVPAATWVTLITAASALRPVSVKDLAGNANANNITITPSGSETIDGQANAVIAMDYGAMTFYPIPTGGWYVK